MSAERIAVRSAAWEEFKRAGPPPPASETWRRTDLAAWRLEELEFPGASPIPPAAPFSAQEAQRLASAGAELLTLEEAASRHPGLVAECLAPCSGPDYRRLEMANLASWRGGVFLRIARGVRLQEPVVLTFRQAGPGHFFPRCLVVLEEGAEASVVEEHVSDGAKGQVSAAFSRAVAAQDARLQYFYTQELPKDAVHFFHQRAELKRGASLLHTGILLGGAKHKSALDVELQEPGARSEIRAVLLGSGRQHFDAYTAQHHCAPRTTSDLLYRTALRERARSVYTGLIRIEGPAAESEAYQSNHNLLLSETARADTTPILEILTNAVRCKHGATAGPLDSEALFYLASRGFEPKEAARSLILGFFEPALADLPKSSAERLRPLIEAAL